MSIPLLGMENLRDENVFDHIKYLHNDLVVQCVLRGLNSLVVKHGAAEMTERLHELHDMLHEAKYLPAHEHTTEKLCLVCGLDETFIAHADPNFYNSHPFTPEA